MSDDAPGPRPRRRWSRVAGWALLILAATSVPLPEGGGRPVLLFGFLEVDKLAHGALYGVLGWLTAGATDAAGPARPGRLLAALAAAAAFAALDEWHQAWIPTRSPEVADWVADAVGIVAGAATRRLRGRGPGRRRERGGAPPGEEEPEERGQEVD